MHWEICHPEATKTPQENKLKYMYILKKYSLVTSQYFFNMYFSLSGNHLVNHRCDIAYNILNCRWSFF